MNTAMTAIDLIPEPTTTKPWNDLFDELKTRYPKVREPILAALAALMQDPDIDAEHAKAVDRRERHQDHRRRHRGGPAAPFAAGRDDGGRAAQGQAGQAHRQGAPWAARTAA
jgi:hypothetical protein